MKLRNIYESNSSTNSMKNMINMTMLNHNALVSHGDD